MSEEAIGAFVHLFYDDLADELATYLAQIPRPVDVYISTDTDEKKTRIEGAFARKISSNLTVQVFPNVGFDIAPFLVGFSKEIKAYRIGIKIHGKKSSYQSQEWGETWRKYLLAALIGDGDQARAALQHLSEHTDLGMVVAAHWPEISHWIIPGRNFNRVQELTARMGGTIDPDEHIEFPSGSMFWFRSDALRPLLDLDLKWEDFEEHSNSRDETLAHAIERCFIITSAIAGMRWTTLPSMTDDISIPDAQAIQMITDSGLFDFEYYRTRYPDVVIAGMHPVEHYYYYGHVENRDPSSHFQTAYYKALAGEKLGQLNPLLHYMARGRQMGCPTQSFLDVTLRSKEKHNEMIHVLERLAALTNKML